MSPVTSISCTIVTCLAYVSATSVTGQVTEVGLLSLSARHFRRTLSNPDWLKLIKTSLGTKRSQGEKLKN